MSDITYEPYEPYEDTLGFLKLKKIQKEIGCKQMKVGVISMKTGSFATDTWVFLDFEMCDFDKDGLMQTGWIEVDGNDYYLNEDGVMLRDVFTEDGCYLNGDGIRTADQLMEGDGITYMVDTDPERAGLWLGYVLS